MNDRDKPRIASALPWWQPVARAPESDQPPAAAPAPNAAPRPGAASGNVPAAQPRSLETEDTALSLADGPLPGTVPGYDPYDHVPKRGDQLDWLPHLRD